MHVVHIIHSREVPTSLEFADRNHPVIALGSEIAKYGYVYDKIYSAKKIIRYIDSRLLASSKNFGELGLKYEMLACLENPGSLLWSLSPSRVDITGGRTWPSTVQPAPWTCLPAAHHDFSWPKNESSSTRESLRHDSNIYIYILLYLYSQISIVTGCLAKLRIEISMDNKLKVQLCSMYAYTLYIVTSDPTIKILGDSSVMCVLV